ncbi:MAG: ABC transporter ATP-binding protein [Parvibaculaceae bacterium]
MIRLQNCGVRFGARWIFRNLNLDVAPGTSLAVLGPNGRGKTTLIRILIGAQRANEGTRQAPDLIGYVPQTGVLAPYSVLDMVVMGRTKALGIFGSPARGDYDSAQAALLLVGCAALASHRYDRISGGERQLVLLARALVTGAQTIVLDEPASALDLANQNRLLGILNGLRRRRKYTILFSSHLPQHALHAADEALLMMPEGEVLRGPVSQVMSERNLERVYGIPVRRIAITGREDAILPLFSETSISMEGSVL